MTLTSAIRSIALLGGLFSLAIVAYYGDHSSLLMIMLGLVFGAWVIAPFVLAFKRADKFADSFTANAVLLVAIIAAAALSLFAYWMTFIDNPAPDAQDGLVFLFVPLYQLIGMSLVFWGMGWISKWTN